MKITFCCIVFNGDYVLRQLIESIYPFAHKIIFIEGVVDYWANKGFKGSTDNTVKIIESYPDREGKIILQKGVIANEKTELCREFMKYVPADTQYLWCVDADEIFSYQGISNAIRVLQTRNPETVSFRSNTFFGGFDYILGGFERDHNFKRVLKYEAGCQYVDHRPPTLSTEKVPNPLHISGKEMAAEGVEMFHYSYVWPLQVKNKIDYYKAAVSKDNCIDDYFNKIWLSWVNGSDSQKSDIEAAYDGVHEFRPAYRGACRTEVFTRQHPAAIVSSMGELKHRFDQELKSLIVN